MDVDLPADLPRTPGKSPLPGRLEPDPVAAGPSRHDGAIPEAHHGGHTNGGNKLYSVKLTSNMLPQIGHLAREVLRGADEKVGIANGCLQTVSAKPVSDDELVN